MKLENITVKRNSQIPQKKTHKENWDKHDPQWENYLDFLSSPKICITAHE